MQVLSDGLVTIFNGAYLLIGKALTPAAMFMLLSAASLAWLARLEVAQLDRKAAKPEVGRH